MSQRFCSLVLATLSLLVLGAACSECQTELGVNKQTQLRHRAKYMPKAVAARIPNICRINISTANSVVATFSGVYLGEGRVLTCYHPFRDTAGEINCYWAGHKIRATLEAQDAATDQVLLKLDSVPPKLKDIVFAKQDAGIGDHLYSFGWGSSTNPELRCIGGTVSNFSGPVGGPLYNVELHGRSRLGDSGGPVFNSSGELTGVAWGTGPNVQAASYTIATVQVRYTTGFCGRCRIFGGRLFGGRRVTRSPVYVVPSYSSVPSQSTGPVVQPPGAMVPIEPPYRGGDDVPPVAIEPPAVVPVTPEISYDKLAAALIAAGYQGPAGKDGQDGQDGRAGGKGDKGEPGRAGVDEQMVVQFQQDMADFKQRLSQLENAKPVADPRIAGIEGKLTKIDDRLASLEDNTAWRELIQELRILQQQVVDLKGTVDNLQDTPAQDGQSSQFQVIYLTSINNPRSKRTDAKVAQMREDGYDYIRVVVLATHEVTVSDVPRLVIFPGKEVVRGESDVLVRLAQLVR